MTIGRLEIFVLIAGDLVCFYAALFVALFLRYQDIPSGELLSIHLVPFTIIFAIWILVFFIAGLYERQTMLLRQRLPVNILNAQIANSIIATLFFYFIPVFDITPKTNLFLVLVFSILFVIFWRKQPERVFATRQRNAALLIAGGREMRELKEEVNADVRYGFHFDAAVDLDSLPSESVRPSIEELMKSKKFPVVVVDFKDERIEPLVPEFYNLLFSDTKLIEMQDMYEDVFLRVPLSLIGHSWFLENVSSAPRRIYDAIKRILDICLGIILLILSIPFDLIAWIAIKIEGRGPAFIVQRRVGKSGKLIRIYKFRTMTTNDEGAYGSATALSNKVTRVGAFLRKSRIDEFPQFWNVITGDLSLVGPRPELPSLDEAYHESVPYYRVRHLLKPGLSGWAQIYHENHPHHGKAIEETRQKLSYDLYYVKNRSLLLDLKIALRTIQTLLSRTGK